MRDHLIPSDRTRKLLFVIPLPLFFFLIFYPLLRGYALLEPTMVIDNPPFPCRRRRRRRRSHHHTQLMRSITHGIISLHCYFQRSQLTRHLTFMHQNADA